MEHQGTPGEGIEDGRPLEEPFAGLMCGLHFAVLDGKTTLLPVFAIPAVSRSTAFGRPREVRRTAANIPHMGCLLRSSKLPSCAFKRQNFVLCGGRRGFAGFLPRAKTSTLPPFRRMAKPYSVNGGRKLFVPYFPQNDFIDSLRSVRRYAVNAPAGSSSTPDGRSVPSRQETPPDGDRRLRPGAPFWWLCVIFISL